MASKTSTLIELLRTGSAQDVDHFLAAGYKPPSDPVKHPILELFYLADPEYSTARDLEGKLEAFLRHGLSVDWKLPRRTPDSKKTRRLVSACLPRSSSGYVSNPFKEASLLARAAGSGRPEMVEAVLKYGAKPFDDQGAAIKVAAQCGQLHTLLLLSEQAQSDDRPDIWGECAESVIECAYKRKASYLLRSWEKIIPQDLTHEQRQLLLGKIFKEESSSQAVSYWMESNPILFACIHDPKYCSLDEVVGSFWPHALREAAHRGTQSPLFKMALSSDAAWLSTPVSSISLQKWTHKTGERGSLFSTKISLPPLQTLLHKTRISGDASGRALARTAKSLIDKGALLWVGDNAPSSPATEAMLWAQNSHNRTKPRIEWLKKRPDWVAPHPVTGETALTTSLNTREADFWIHAGVSLSHIDALGNQMATYLLSHACRHTDENAYNVSGALEWAKWMTDGWENRSFPTQGYANGQTMAEWSTFNSDTYRILSSITPPSQIDINALLQASVLNLNTPLVRSLIEEGANPNAQRSNGWNGMQHLSRWCASSPNGTQIKSIHAILDAFDNLALENSQFWADAQKMPQDDPWQIITRGLALRTLYDESYAATNPLHRLFGQLHAARCQDASLWKWEDAGHVIEVFAQQYELVDNLNLFAADLPKEILDDLLLCTVNPQRWESPHFDLRSLSYGQQLALILMSKGASWDGVDLQGNRLIDLLPEFQKGVDGSQQNSIAFMEEVQSVFEQQSLQGVTPSVQSTARRVRL